jgi:hypothetical protein
MSYARQLLDTYPRTVNARVGGCASDARSSRFSAESGPGPLLDSCASVVAARCLARPSTALGAGAGVSRRLTFRNESSSGMPTRMRPLPTRGTAGAC